MSTSEFQQIAYWPSDDWCSIEGAETYMRVLGLSDDYVVTDVPIGWDDNQIEEFVTLVNRGEEIPSYEHLKKGD